MSDSVPFLDGKDSDFIAIPKDDGYRVLAESAAYRTLKRALEDIIADPESNDASIGLADQFLTLMERNRKIVLDRLYRREKNDR